MTLFLLIVPALLVGILYALELLLAWWTTETDT
jgi:hypothetical protein